MSKRFVLALIRLYQRTTRFVPKVCRFYPSCSQYALEAVERYGALQGTRLGALRILRCHPLHPGGVDFVPDLANDVTACRHPYPHFQ
jgi:putative membrane protein insertion efficiency factor